jgi:hypothetical protein
VKGRTNGWVRKRAGPDLRSPMETRMVKSIVTVAAAAAILSLGSLLSAPAQAGGGGTSAPSKYNNADQSRAAHHASQSYAITEFSSSSARAPKK